MVRVIRDQGNKTLEVYLARVRKYVQTLPETIAQPTANGAASGPRMGSPTPSADATWTGWAISSFTNKLATASGEMSSKPPPFVVGGSAARTPVTLQSTASPLSATSSRPSSSASNPTKPTLGRNSTETTKLAASFVAPEIIEDDWGNDQWGGIDESGDADVNDAWGAMVDDTVALPSASPAISVTSPSAEPDIASPVPESLKPSPKKKQDASGEPDFATWLNTQKSTTTKKAMPKGLPMNKSSSSIASKTNPRPLTSRTSTSSSPGPKKVVQPPKPNEPKKEETAADDDWGESWD